MNFDDPNGPRRGSPGGGDPERRALDAFLSEYWRDRNAGQVKPLREYLLRYPEFERAIAAEYLGAEAVGREGGIGDGVDAPVVIGHYRVLRELGRGGQGQVYLARDLKLSRDVALKVLKFGPIHDRTSLERFRREAEIASRLDHPGICTVYDAGEDRGDYWIAMRYVEGVTLAKRIAAARAARGSDDSTSFAVALEPAGIRDAGRSAAETAPESGPRTWSEISGLVRLFEEAARALHVAHEDGVVHRDVKPGNLMITPEGRPVVLDFGLAEDLDADGPSLTRTGELMGTPQYMSPEQIAARRIRLDRRTDVYSLGVSLYESLTLVRPFDAPTREGIYQAILGRAVVDPRKLNPAIGKDLVVVVATAMERDRNRRYATALDFAEDLRRVSEREPIRAKPPGLATKLIRWAQRDPKLACAAGVAFALLVTALGVTLRWLSDSREAEAATRERLRRWDVMAANRLASELQTEADGPLHPVGPETADGTAAWIARARALVALAGTFEGAEALGDEPSGELLGPARRQTHEAALAELRATARDLSAPRAEGRVTIADMEERLRAARTLRSDSVESVEAAWAAANERLASREGFAGLRLEPMLGLVPLGPDPESDMEEFAVLGTGPVPARDGASGVLRHGADGPGGSATVLVLLPGGPVDLGAQGTDPSAPNYDPDASALEGPVHRVTFAPFLIGKTEVSQAQWEKVMGANPSAYRVAAGRTSALQSFGPGHPVERVRWDDAVEFARRIRCSLPTEAEWESACRAGSAGPWCFGRDPSLLKTYANTYDCPADIDVGTVRWSAERWDDPWRYTSPVGILRGNGFGLHDMHGNVSEWCADAVTNEDWPKGYAVPTRAEGPFRIRRGGAFYFDGLESPVGSTGKRVDSRSAARRASDPTERQSIIGVRIVRRTS